MEQPTGTPITGIKPAVPRRDQTGRWASLAQHPYFIREVRDGDNYAGERGWGEGDRVDVFSLHFDLYSYEALTHVCPQHRLVGLVVKASASRAEGPGFESRLRRDFFGVESYQ